MATKKATKKVKGGGRGELKEFQQRNYGKPRPAGNPIEKVR